MLDGSHIVEAVSQRDQHHTDVFGHGHKHFTDGLGLGVVLVRADHASRGA